MQRAHQQVSSPHPEACTGGSRCGARALCFKIACGALAEYETRLAEFLREVADKAGVQVILITHSDAFSDAADARYRFSLGPDGKTRVTAT
jgi:hypothetical protein